MAHAIAAKEAVGYYETWNLGPELGGGLALGPDGITGWVFKMSFERQAGSPDFTLNMAASPAHEGFRIIDPIARQISCRILPATLQAITDTTGKFELFADLLATPPGAVRFAVDDFVLTVVKGPTA